MLKKQMLFAIFAGLGFVVVNGFEEQSSRNDKAIEIERGKNDWYHYNLVNETYPFPEQPTNFFNCKCEYTGELERYHKKLLEVCDTRNAYYEKIAYRDRQYHEYHGNWILNKRDENKKQIRKLFEAQTERYHTERRDCYQRLLVQKRDQYIQDIFENSFGY